jgi:Cu/Ag efflux pump CusA
MEGALLRLRPKLMTVSTIVAGLLPIFWSTRVGSEVIRPLATPVLGGMVSSLAHVLIVTPESESFAAAATTPPTRANWRSSSPRRLSQYTPVPFSVRVGVGPLP